VRNQIKPGIDVLDRSGDDMTRSAAKVFYLSTLPFRP
jgi:hypothetical protein